MDFSTNQVVDIIFRLAVLLFSVVIHEVSHGAVAYALGDNTAKDAGRLTLNPIPHIDLLGSIVMPLLIGFGWAKPVPYNPNNLSNRRWGPLMVGVAGPLSNILVAIFFGLFVRFRNVALLANLDSSFFVIAQGIVILNLGLALFNLIPIPPLDGSKVLFAFLPRTSIDFEIFLERYGMLVLLFVIVLMPGLLLNLILPAAQFLFNLITGGLLL